MSSAESATEPRTVTTEEGRRMAYTTYGSPDGTPVVFLHGTPGSRLLGQLLADAASDRDVRLVAVDRPGYGRSPPWQGGTPRDVAAGVDAVLDDLDVSRVGVVGFSGGSRHAIAVANHSSVAVEGVDVVAGSVPPSAQETVPRVQRILGTMARYTPPLLGAIARGQAAIARRGPPSMVTAQYTTDGAPLDVGAEDAEVVKRDFREALATGASGFVSETRALGEAWIDRIEAVTCDLRFWHGEWDENVPLPGVRRLVDRLDGATLRTFPDADHLGTLLAAREPVLDQQSQRD